MKKIESYLHQITNKIYFKQKELNFENDNTRKVNLKKELDVLKLKKQIALLRKKIKIIEG